MTCGVNLSFFCSEGKIVPWLSSKGVIQQCISTSGQHTNYEATASSAAKCTEWPWHCFLPSWILFTMCCTTMGLYIARFVAPQQYCSLPSHSVLISCSSAPDPAPCSKHGPFHKFTTELAYSLPPWRQQHFMTVRLLNCGLLGWQISIYAKGAFGHAGRSDRWRKNSDKI